MPAYEFQCPQCGKTVEKIQPFIAEPPKCPDCQSVMKRLPGTYAIHMKIK